MVRREFDALFLANGKRRWSATAPWQLFRALDVYRQGDGHLLLGMQGLARFRTGNGALVWRYDAQTLPIRMASVADGRIFLLRGNGPLLAASSAAKGTFSIACVDLRRGTRAWRYPLSAQGPVRCSTSTGDWCSPPKDRLMALDAKSGKRLFGRTLPFDMIEASPTEARFRGQSDLLVAHKGSLILAREFYGVAALSLNNGKRLWQQPHYLSPVTGSAKLTHLSN